MPRAAKLANAFPPRAASEIVGLTTHMLNYLARHGYLVPSYDRTGTRGRTRYYSYRDLVIARLVAQLLGAGLELSRLKAGLATLRTHPRWTAQDPRQALRLLVTDGKDLYFPMNDGELVDLTARGQLAFAFVLDVHKAAEEVRSRLSAEQLVHYNLANRRRIAA